MTEEPFKLTQEEIKLIEDTVNKTLTEGISFSTKFEIVREIKIDDECTMLVSLDLLNHNPCCTEYDPDEAEDYYD